jgi:hypothetical protein
LHDSAPHSVLMRQIIDANAQYERANGRKRQHDCLRHAASRGEWKGGIAPFGYLYVKESRTLVIDEERAPLITQMYEQIAANRSPYEIAADWRRCGIRGKPTNPSKSPNHIPFKTGSEIIRMARSPIYRGVVRVRKGAVDTPTRLDKNPDWEEFRGKQPRLVSDEVWYAANRMLDQSCKIRRREHPLGTHKLNHLLQGLLRCQHCDYSMTPGRSMPKRGSGIRHRYYKCVQKQKGAGESGCTTGQVSAPALEAAVIGVLQLMETNPASFARYGIDATISKRKAHAATLENEIKTIELEIGNERKEIENLISFIRKGESHLVSEANAAAQAAKVKLGQLEGERIRLQAMVNRISARTPPLSELSKQCGIVLRALRIANTEQQCVITREIFRRIEARRVSILTDKIKSKRIFPERTFRLEIVLNTDALMCYGRHTVPDILASSGYAELQIAITIEIHSNAREQRMTILEHGYSTISADFIALSRNAVPSNVPKADEPKNPIQKAVRWQVQLQSTGASMEALALSEKVSKGLISQHIALLKLPATIVDFLKEGRDGIIGTKFSLRELQRYLLLDRHVAAEQFHQRIRGLPVQRALDLS